MSSFNCPSFRSKLAEATVEVGRILKAGTAAGSCVKAAAATDKLIGTSAGLLDKAVGEMVDVASGTLHEVRLGGNVVEGDALTSDANGKAIATTTAGHRIIGYADQAGVLDDLIMYVRAPGVY